MSEYECEKCTLEYTVFHILGTRRLLFQAVPVTVAENRARSESRPLVWILTLNLAGEVYMFYCKFDSSKRAV